MYEYMVDVASSWHNGQYNVYRRKKEDRWWRSDHNWEYLGTFTSEPDAIAYVEARKHLPVIL